jgi:DNA-binding LacI/PurR family transcriptional regulator
MLKNNALPQAVVTVSDNLAIGVITELKEQGLHVPKDVAVIGFNDIAAASVVEPRLTSIGLPLFEMGQQTMLTLTNVLNKDNQNWIHKEFLGKLVIRESCGC